jgi:hypothetical protein
MTPHHLAVAGGIPPSGHPPAPGLEREEPRQWQEDDIPAPRPDPDPVTLDPPAPPQPPGQAPSSTPSSP